jgi:FMN-dependent NADH-azoreductase
MESLMNKQTKILRIDSSARTEGSVTRAMVDKAIDQLASQGPISITARDVSAGVPFVDGDWVSANFTPAEQRTPAQRARLAGSDAHVEEVKAADMIVIGLPVYNFGIPATLKAWIDQIARAGLTFRYTEAGPVGLMGGKRAIILLASGGTAVGSEIDFATPYLRHALSFIGIQDITIIAADQLGMEADEKIKSAHASITALAA